MPLPTQEGRRVHPDAGRAVALSTTHGKERLLARPLRVAPGLEILVPPDLDTDALGAFTGEVARVGTPLEVARRKSRLGIVAGSLPLGLASEGSVGPHPAIPFLPIDHELLLFIDDERGTEVVEQTVSARHLCLDRGVRGGRPRRRPRASRIPDARRDRARQRLQSRNLSYRRYAWQVGQ